MTRSIDISNYEEWFMDHLDGTLTANETRMLTEFLIAHPALNDELQSFEQLILEPTHSAIPLEDKAKLKRPELEDEAIIAWMETGHVPDSRLTPADHVLLDQYAKTRLAVDSSISFPDKDSLKKKDGILIPLWFKISSIAATLLLAFLLVTPDTTEQQYVERDNEYLPWDQGLEIHEEIASTLTDEQLKEASTLPVQEGVVVKDDVKVNPPTHLATQVIPHIDQSTEVEKEDPLPIEVEPVLTKNEEPVLAPKKIEEPLYAVIDQPLTAHPKHTPVSSQLNKASSPAKALDILKRVTADSEILAIQDLDENDPYIEGTLSVGSFSLSIKRKRR